MRDLYIEILKVLATHAEAGGDEMRSSIAQLLVQLNNENVSDLDQNVVDFMSEFYIFLTFDKNSERADTTGAISNWTDVHQRIAALSQ